MYPRECESIIIRKPPMFSRLKTVLKLTTPAVWILLILAVGSGVAVLSRPTHQPAGLSLWVFSSSHKKAFAPLAEKWNAEHAEAGLGLDILLIEFVALERRLLSAFMSGTPVADLVETERVVAAKTFTGPLEDVGFVDLTDILRSEGLLEGINAPSLVPWTSRGRIFGIPHDVHPVLLGYRADIVEGAGIDLEKVETWKEFFTALRPLMTDENGDGRPDRYPLNFWASNFTLLEVLLLQADGSLFDEGERLAIATDRNAEILSTLATWCGGPGRVVVDAPEFTAPGNALRLRGTVLASLMPDWLAGQWRIDLPALAGKVKLMPLPAWEKGGRRTSVWGGTMLGITKASRNFDAAWRIAKHLYLSPEANAQFFTETLIIPPFKADWDNPVFSAPDPYFCGQQVGRLYIDQAPHVPPRTGSPYSQLALSRVNEVLLALVERVNREQISDPSVLMAEARERLIKAQFQVQVMIDRNVFLRPAAGKTKPEQDNVFHE